MKIVFMGTPDFAKGALLSIIEAGHYVSLVVTNKDKPKGRSGKMVYSPIKECAIQHDIPVFQPDKLKSKEVIDRILEEKADIIVVAAYGHIIPNEIIEAPKYGTINVHASLLPRHRGASPIQSAILAGDEYTGVTIMNIVEKLDAGEMLYKEEIKIEKDDTAGSLFDKLANLGGIALQKALTKIENGEIVPQKQDESLVTFSRIIKKEAGNIDWSNSNEYIERMIRAYCPWPSAYSFLNGKMYKIFSSKINNEILNLKEGEIYIGDNELIVGCNKGSINILEIQPEGKKRMKIEDFLRGSKIKSGEMFIMNKEV